MEQFRFIFYAVSRLNLKDKPHREEIVASSEKEARKQLAGRFVLSFAGKIPTGARP